MSGELTRLDPMAVLRGQGENWKGEWKMTFSDQSYTCAANTDECFRLCVGRKVIGVLFSALPLSRRDIASGTKTLVFEDGYGLTISSNGSYWTETKDDVARAVAAKREELGRTEREIREVLALAGDK